MIQEFDSPWFKLIHHGLEFFGRYYSNYRGFVLSNEDPQNQNRLFVVIPGINPNTKKGTWAYPKNSWGGKDYGVSMLPLKNDMVFIEFQHGDTEVPIWSHAGWALDEKPEELKPTTNYGFKTPKGNLVVIEDGESDTDGRILVKSKTGKEYFLISKELFELEAKEIKLGKDGDEAAVLGDTLKDQLNTILDLVSDMATTLSTHSHPSNGTPPTEAPKFITMITQVQSMISKLTLLLSTKVKLDK